MAVSYGMSFAVDFDAAFPLRAYIVGEVVQPVPPVAAGGLPFRPVVLEGLTVQPRAESSGQAKWTTWVVRATGLRAVDASPAKTGSAKSTAA